MKDTAVFHGFSMDFPYLSNEISQKKSNDQVDACFTSSSSSGARSTSNLEPMMPWLVVGIEARKIGL
jgi:hypothetical protein